MATGVRELLDVDWALSTTGVAGPELQEGHAAGTVFVGLAGRHSRALRAARARRRPLGGPVRQPAPGRSTCCWPRCPVDELTAVADALYAGSADDFTEARNQAAKQAQDSGDKELAARIKKLKKPSVAAWAVNLLVRRESEQIDSVLGLAEQLRAAAEALDGDGAARADPPAAPADQCARVDGEVAGPRRRRAPDRPGRRPGRGHAHRRDARPGRRAGRPHRPGGHRVHLDRRLRARRGRRGRGARGDRRAGHPVARRGRGAGPGRRCTSYRTEERSSPPPRTPSRRPPSTSPPRSASWPRRRPPSRSSTRGDCSSRARPTSCADGSRRSRTAWTRSTRTSRRPTDTRDDAEVVLTEARRSQAAAQEELARLRD